MKYFNVKPLFLIAVPRPLSNINFLSCSTCGSRLSWLLQSPRPTTSCKIKVADFFRRRTQARLSLSECFFFFSGFRGILYFFIWISWSSVILWSQAFGGRTFQTSKREKFRQEQRQNILQTCLLSDLGFYCCWLVLANRLRPKIYKN